MFSITLIANAGLLIQCGNKRILLDGLENAEEYPFSSTPEDVLKEMTDEETEGSFKDIDYLVFSHNHPDHFSKVLTKIYISKNKVRKLIFTADGENEDLVCCAKTNQVSVWTMDMVRGKIHQYILGGGIGLSTICMKHIPHIFPKDLCHCILLQYDGKNILFLSDCSYEEKVFFQKFKDIRLHAVFMNPYFYYSNEGRKILDEYLFPERIIIYHIPFEADDRIHMRSFVLQMTRKFPRGNILILNAPFQKINI